MLDAVLVGKFVKSKYSNVFLRYSSTVVDKFGSRLTRHNFLPTWTGIHLPMLLGTGILRLLRLAEDDALCCFLFGSLFCIQCYSFQCDASGSVTFGFLVEIWEMQPVTRCLPWILFATDFGLWNHSRLVSWCLDTWEMQSVARCLAWILLLSDLGLRLFLSWDQL